MKKVLLILMFLLTITTHAQELQEVIGEQIESSGVSSITIEDNGYGDIFGGFQMDDLTAELAAGKWSWNPIDILKKVMSFFFKEIQINLKLMLQVIILVLITSIITTMQDSFGGKGVGEVGFFACYILIVGIVIKGFTLAASVGTQFVTTLDSFIKVLIPTMMVLIASSGAALSAAAFQPVLLIASELIGVMIKDILMPLLFLAMAMSMANNIGTKFNVTRIVKLIHNVIKWSLGIMLTIFVGIISLQSLATPALDGIGGKTAKYAVSTFVPVVGKILTDTLDLVVGSSVIIKNSVGVAGIIAIIVMCFVPLVQVLAQISIFALSAAVVEPIADKRIVKCISSVSETLTLLFVMMLSQELMFIINIAIVVSAGSNATMLGR